MDDKIKKKAILEGIVEMFPAFPAAWKELSGLLDDDDASLRGNHRAWSTILTQTRRECCSLTERCSYIVVATATAR
jgi:hypothetical protein